MNLLNSITSRESQSQSPAQLNAYLASLGLGGGPNSTATAAAAFDEKEFVTHLVSQATVESIKQQHQFFVTAKNSLAVDIQKNVFSNYHEFISVSKEIAKLDKDLLELKDVVGKMKVLINPVIVSQQHEESLGTGGAGGFTSRATTAGSTRTSGIRSVSANSGLPLMNPAEGRKRQEALALQIPDLLRFHQPNVDRYLMKEGYGLSIVNPDDVQLGKSAHLFLYNDLFVLGLRKKKTVNSKSKTIIEASWDLRSITVVDIQYSSDFQNSFKVIAGTDALILRADTEEVKKNWMTAIQKALECLRTGGSTSQINNLSARSSSKLQIFDDSQNTLLRNKYKTMAKSVFQLGNSLENINPDLNWLHLDMVDELDVHIAHRDYDQAIKVVDRAKSILKQYSDKSMDEVINLLHSRTLKLENLLSKELIRKPSAKCISRMCKLGLATRARDLFLRNMSTMIEAGISSIPFRGDIAMYINDLTFLFFGFLKRCIRQYRAYFSDFGLSSGLITWLQKELVLYWSKFRSQVFHEEQSFEIIGECLESAREGCVVLKDVGVDIGHVFEIGAVRSDVLVSLDWFRTRVCAEIAKSIADDEFMATQNQLNSDVAFEVEKPVLNSDLPQASKTKISLETAIKLSPSAKKFTNLLLKFLFIDLQSLISLGISHTYYSEITEAVSSFYELYFRHVLELSHDSQFLERQVIVSSLSITFLSNQLLTFFMDTMSKKTRIPHEFMVMFGKQHVQDKEREHLVGFNRPVPEWEKLSQRLEVMTALLISSYVLKRSRQLASSSYVFGPYSLTGKSTVDLKSVKSDIRLIDFSSDTYPVLETLIPQDSIIQCVKKLVEYEKALQDAIKVAGRELPTINTETVMKEIIQSFFKDMTHDLNWEDKTFGYTGLHQFMLDMHFFLKISDAYLTPITRKHADDISSRALKLYFSKCSEEKKKRVLKPGEWYDERVNSIVQKERMNPLGTPVRPTTAVAMEDPKTPINGNVNGERPKTTLPNLPSKAAATTALSGSPSPPSKPPKPPGKN